MTIFKRLKNLWILSALEPVNVGVTREEKDVFTEYKKPENHRPQATIIKLTKKDPVEEALLQVNEEQNG